MIDILGDVILVVLAVVALGGMAALQMKLWEKFGG